MWKKRASELSHFHLATAISTCVCGVASLPFATLPPFHAATFTLPLLSKSQTLPDFFFKMPKATKNSGSTSTALSPAPEEKLPTFETGDFKIMSSDNHEYNVETYHLQIWSLIASC